MQPVQEIVKRNTEPKSIFNSGAEHEKYQEISIRCFQGRCEDAKLDRKILWVNNCKN